MRRATEVCTVDVVVRTLDGGCWWRGVVCQLVCSTGVEVGCDMNVGYTEECAVTLPDAFGIGLCARLKS